MRKKFLIPLLTLFTFTFGIICFLLPFLPFGGICIMLTALLVSPYFAPMEKIIKWVLCKDKTGITAKACTKAAALYQWAGDEEKAHKLLHTFVVIPQPVEEATVIDHKIFIAKSETEMIPTLMEVSEENQMTA